MTDTATREGQAAQDEGTDEARDVPVVDRPRIRQVATLAYGSLAFWFVIQWLWAPPLGIVIQGLIVGGLTALIAFGLALVYRSNRIINFAQGDLGGVPGALGVVLILGPGVPYLLAFPIAILAGIAMGAIIEFVFIRRFFKAPRLILTVVTIGVSQILAGLTTALPDALDVSRPSESFPSPLNFSLTFGSTVISGNEIIALLAVPLVIAGLLAFFRYTNFGIAVRASAESAERAALLGVPVKRVQTVVWIVAAVLGTIATFMRAGVMGLPIGSALGATILLRALAAGVIGRMERLPTIFVASLALGVMENAVLYRTTRPFLADGILFLVVIVALLVQRRGKVGRVDDDQTSTWQAAREVRPIPRELIHLPEVRWGMRGLLALLGLMAISLPLFLGDGQVNLAALIAIFAIIGVSLVVLTGWAGQVSLGQFGFVGLGAAAGGFITTTWGWDLSLALVGAGIVGAAAATLIGLPALRIRGLFLAVTTLAFALAVSSVALNSEFVHWLPPDYGIVRPPLFGRIVVESETRFYYLCLAVLLLTILAVRGLRHSRTGRVLIGVRENQRAAQAFGVNATAAKLTAFAISGFIAAVAGGLFVHHQQGLGITSYEIDASRDAFVMVVIGGLGSVPGAILGAIFIEGIGYFRNSFPEFLRPYLLFLTTGVGLIFVLLMIPGGFSQVFYDLRDRGLRLIADRRRMLVPSLVADARAQLPEGFEPEADATYQPPPVELDVEEALTTAAFAGEAAGVAPAPTGNGHGNGNGNGNGHRRRDRPLVAAGRSSRD